jgi:hypothetical protein
MNFTSKRISLAMLPAMILAFTACKTGPSAPNVTENSAVIDTKNGAMVVDTMTLTATVKAIDSRDRKLTLTTSNGYQKKVKVPSSAVNFDQIQVGDHVIVKATEEFAVFLSPMGVPTSAGAGAAVALAPRGALPGGFVAGTEEVTARITGIDMVSRSVTLKFVDGMSKTLRVARDVDLGKARVGDDVTVQVAESVAIDVTPA